MLSWKSVVGAVSSRIRSDQVAVFLRRQHARTSRSRGLNPHEPTRRSIISKKEAYEKKLHAELDEWSAEIDKLKAKADRAEADARLEYHEQIDELRAMQKKAKEKLSELQRAGDTAWEDLKHGIENAWDSLGKAVNSAKSRFR